MQSPKAIALLRPCVCAPPSTPGRFSSHIWIMAGQWPSKPPPTALTRTYNRKLWYWDLKTPVFKQH